MFLLRQTRRRAAVLEQHLDLVRRRRLQPDLGPALGRCRLNCIAQQTGQGLTQLTGVRLHRQPVRPARLGIGRVQTDLHLPSGRQVAQAGADLVDQPRQIDRLLPRQRRPGELPHVAQDSVNPLRLLNDCPQRPFPVRYRVAGFDRVRFLLQFVPPNLREQVLGLAGNDRQWVVDLMACAGGELGQCRQIAGPQAIGLAGALLLQGPVEVIKVALQLVLRGDATQLAVLCRQGQQVG
jgi:hypothetical protein